MNSIWKTFSPLNRRVKDIQRLYSQLSSEEKLSTTAPYLANILNWLDKCQFLKQFKKVGIQVPDTQCLPLS